MINQKVLMKLESIQKLEREHEEGLLRRAVCERAQIEANEALVNTKSFLDISENKLKQAYAELKTLLIKKDD
jgi:hypothetical protein